MMSQLKDTEHIASLMTVNLNLEVENQQRILELESMLDVLRQLNMYLSREVQILETEKASSKKPKTNRQDAKELFLAGAIEEH